jgi:polyhydroxyalkanoate synthase
MTTSSTSSRRRATPKTSAASAKNGSNGVSKNGGAKNGAPPAHPRPVSAPEPAVVDELDNGELVAMPTIGSLAKGIVTTLAQRKPLARESTRMAREMLRIAAGRSSIEPSKGDKRFLDRAWQDNPVYRRVGQGYLAAGRSLSRLVDDLESSGRDWHEIERARFAVNLLTSALAPTNTLPGNPAALKRAFDTTGRSLAAGAGNAWHDLRHNGAMPSQTDRSAFVVGRDLAVSPGAVVHRDEVAEIIHYAPSTDTVAARPLLIIPPPIGRYYFLDLRPTRSFVEYAVSRGIQVFMVSWRNPTKAQGSWGLDTYAGRVVSALDVARDVTGSDDVNVLGFCAGGILSATVLNHLAATKDTRIHSASFGVTLLDFDERAPIGAFSAPRMLELAKSKSKSDGIITGRALGKVFAWMRPDDLVFNYVVNNYLLGERPPVFDILAWNADATNLPAALHEQFLEIFRDNTLCEAGKMTVLGTPVDLSRVSVPTFVTGAVSDHLTPWTGCYRTTQLLSGPSTFVLSNAGHIASLVNPPGNPKASYYIGGDVSLDPEGWRATAEKMPGTWWQSWADWVLERSGPQGPPPPLGSENYPAMEPAPGRFVLDGQP